MNPKERPHPCKIDECKQSFATEEHLDAHRKKHDLLLNLELPNKSNLFADQTPTPTRLIGKCEEVGLFEDLQHVNPFEETFRRAVEEKCSDTTIGAHEKNVSAIESIGTGDDTLHTPRIFPLLERRESRKLSKLIISKSSSKKDSLTTVSQSTSSSRTQLRKNPQIIKPVSAKPLVNILPKATPSSQPVIIVSCENEDRLPTTKATSPLHPVKAKLKKYLARNGTLTDLQQESVQLTPAKTSPITLRHKIKSPAVISKNSSSHASGDAIVQKHERWKAAAKRYRTRVKQTQDGLCRKNMQLEEENLRLKTELAQLKHALSLHKDCSVTRALISGTDAVNTAGPFSSMVIPEDKNKHNRIQLQSKQSVHAQVVKAVSTISNPLYIILRGGKNSQPNAAADYFEEKNQYDNGCS